MKSDSYNEIFDPFVYQSVNLSSSQHYMQFTLPATLLKENKLLYVELTDRLWFLFLPQLQQQASILLSQKGPNVCVEKFPASLLLSQLNGIIIAGSNRYWFRS